MADRTTTLYRSKDDSGESRLYSCADSPAHTTRSDYDTALDETFDESDRVFDDDAFEIDDDSESSLPPCCRTKSKLTTSITDPSITQAPFSETFHATRDHTDLGPGPWRNVRIPENLRRQDIAPGMHRTFPRTQGRQRPSRNLSAYQDSQHMLDLSEVVRQRKSAPRYFSTPQSASFRGGEGLQDESTLWGQHLSSFDPTNDSGWSKGVRMDSFNVIKYMTPSPKQVKVAPRLMQSFPRATTPQGRVDPNYTQYSQVSFPDSSCGGLGCGNGTFNLDQKGSSAGMIANQTFPTQNLGRTVGGNGTFNMPQRTFNMTQGQGTFNMTQGQGTFNMPQGTFARPQQTFNAGNATFHATRDMTDVGPWRNISIPQNLQRLNVCPGASKSIPRTQVPQRPRTYSTHEDSQPILNLPEVAYYRKQAPRYYSTPERSGFEGQGADMSSVWGQDFSDASVDESSYQDSSAGWSQGVRMDEFNVIRNMTPSPKNVRGAPRLMQSFPRSAKPSGRMDPNYTQSSQVGLSDSSCGALACGNGTFNLDQKGLSAANQTFATQNLGRTVGADGTFNMPQGTFNMTQDQGTFNLHRRNLARPQQTPQQTYDAGNATFHATRDMTDVGPWRNINIPANLQRRNIPAGASKSIPRTQVARRPRTYSAHEDSQPILNLPEVADYRKRAPRYYSTPERSGFEGQGADMSSVWGQDFSDASVDESSYQDSSAGWSQGVRMDEFNVIRNMTPSPKNVRGAPRLMQTYPAPRGQPLPMSPNLTRYSGLQISSEQPSSRGATFARSAGSTGTTNVPPASRNYLTFEDDRTRANLNATYDRSPVPYCDDVCGGNKGKSPSGIQVESRCPEVLTNPNPTCCPCPK